MSDPGKMSKWGRIGSSSRDDVRLLHPKKIGRRLCFDRAELDRVLANGDHKRGRGRPRKG